MSSRRKDGGVDAPISLCGFFGDGSGDDAEGEVPLIAESQILTFGRGEQFNEVDDAAANSGTDVATKTLKLPISLLIRQTEWHPANANQVWPGSFLLADFLTYGSNYDRYIRPLQSVGAALELGAATGALSIFLLKHIERMTEENWEAIGFNHSMTSLQSTSNPYPGDIQMQQMHIITSDMADGGVVQENIAYNCRQNGLREGQIPLHIAHTWGENWSENVRCARMKVGISAAECCRPLGLRFIFASDILLYVAAYPALVRTLVQLFEKEQETLLEFVMAWNRRIDASKEFFVLMEASGFQYVHRGRCVYSFFYSRSSGT